MRRVLAYCGASLGLLAGIAWGGRSGIVFAAGFGVAGCGLGCIAGFTFAEVVDNAARLASRFPEESPMRWVIGIPLLIVIICAMFAVASVIAHSVRNW